MKETNLTVKEIEDLLITMNGGVRNNICVPNVSWGAGIGYEADLVIISKSGYATEYEIKRSYSDFIADFKKDKCAHKAQWVYKFAYVIPIVIKEKVLDYFKANDIKLPAIICYTEDKRLYQCGGDMKVEGGRKMFIEEQLKIARLGTLRYCNLRYNQ